MVKIYSFLTIKKQRHVSVGQQIENTAVRSLNLSKQDIFTFVKMIAEKPHFSPGEDIKTFVTSIGGRIEYTEASIEEKPDSIVTEDRNKFTIYISVFTTSLRDNFTIAHELGHYFLHYLAGAKGEGSMHATRAVNSDPKLNCAEYEAN